MTIRRLLDLFLKLRRPRVQDRDPTLASVGLESFPFLARWVTPFVESVGPLPPGYVWSVEFCPREAVRQRLVIEARPWDGFPAEVDAGELAACRTRAATLDVSRLLPMVLLYQCGGCATTHANLAFLLSAAAATSRAQA